MTRRPAICAIAGALAAFGCSSGSSDAPPTDRPVAADAPLAWVRDDEPAAFTRARAEHKGVMVHFAAAWAAQPLELERTFATPAVRPALARSFVPLRIDVTDDSDAAREALARYHAVVPTVVFLTADGRELARVDRVLAPSDFLGVVRHAATSLTAR